MASTKQQKLAQYFSQKMRQIQTLMICTNCNFIECTVKHMQALIYKHGDFFFLFLLYHSKYGIMTYWSHTLDPTQLITNVVHSTKSY